MRNMSLDELLTLEARGEREREEKRKREREMAQEEEAEREGQAIKRSFRSHRSRWTR